jgi:hypothetical protein
MLIIRRFPASVRVAPLRIFSIPCIRVAKLLDQ